MFWICISIREFSNKLTLKLFNSLDTHFHDVLYYFLEVLTLIIYLFFNITSPITIYISCWNMSEYIKHFILFGKFKHSLTPKIVDLESILQRIIKVNWCSTINNYVHFVYNHNSILIWQPKFFNYQIALNWNNKR